MKSLLQPGDKVEVLSNRIKSRQERTSYSIVKKLHEGTQGEIYRVNDPCVAVKWYKPEYLAHDRRLEERLGTAIERGSPNLDTPDTPHDFVWPFAKLTLAGRNSFGGYAMPFMECPPFASFAAIPDLNPSGCVLARAGFRLAADLLQLHVGRGLCYRDISLGNIWFDPNTGDVRIIDNDNVDVEGRAGGLSGTPGFMPPEVVRGEAPPTRSSDLFALSVLLFMMLMIDHPLRGQRIDRLKLDKNDPSGWKRLTGEDPVFILDPSNDSNRPITGTHVLNFWPIYPAFIHQRFIQAFTTGLHDPDARISGNEWKQTMAQLRDLVFPCPNCSTAQDGVENYYDPAMLTSMNQSQICWHCHSSMKVPPLLILHIRDKDYVCVLRAGVQLFPHHLAVKRYDFSKAWAAVLDNPLGLKNLSSDNWTCRNERGQLVILAPGDSVSLQSPRTINFGRVVGEIKI